MTPTEYGAEIYTADGMYIRQIVVSERGSMVPQHAHVWGHTTMLAVGSIRVWRDGVADPETYHAPTGLFIKAGVKHAFLTLTDNTVLYCLHSLHSGDVVSVLAEHELTPDDARALVEGL